MCLEMLCILLLCLTPHALGRSQCFWVPPPPWAPGLGMTNLFKT